MALTEAGVKDRVKEKFEEVNGPSPNPAETDKFYDAMAKTIFSILTEDSSVLVDLGTGEGVIQ